MWSVCRRPVDAAGIAAVQRGTVFLAADEDNKAADLSCGHKSCQLTANKLKIFVATTQMNFGLAATKKEAFVGVVCLPSWTRRVGVSLKSLCRPWINKTRLGKRCDINLCVNLWINSYAPLSRLNVLHFGGCTFFSLWVILTRNSAKSGQDPADTC